MSNDSSKSAAAGEVNPYKQWPWGPQEAIIVSVVAYLAGQLLVGGVFGLALAAMGWSAGRINNAFNGIGAQFGLVLTAEGLSLLTLWWFIRYRKAHWRIVGFLRSPRWKDVGLAVLGFVIYFALLLTAAGLARAIFHINLDQKQELGFDHIVGSSEKIMAFVSLVLVPPFVEETIFRGFLFTGLRKKLPLLAAAILTSLLFAGPHLLESSSGPLWIAGIDTFVMSLVLCYLREKTGALWSGILIHMLKNGVAFLFLYVFVS